MSELNLNTNFAFFKTFQIDSLDRLVYVRTKSVNSSFVFLDFLSGHDVVILESDLIHISPLGSHCFDDLVCLKI